MTLAIYTHALKSDKQVAAEVWNQARGGVVLSTVIKKTAKTASDRKENWLAWWAREDSDL